MVMAEAETPADNAPESNEMHWYVLKVTSNRERTIRDNLLRKIKRDGLEPFFGEIIIPTERIAETKNGKKRVTERKLYPGYIMVQCILNDESWFLVRETSGVGDFTGANGKPIPMKDEEIRRMLGQEVQKKEEAAAPKIKMGFVVGDRVKIKEGTFESYEGSVSTIDETNGRVTVMIEFLGRSTPVDFEYWQMERV